MSARRRQSDRGSAGSESKSARAQKELVARFERIAILTATLRDAAERVERMLQTVGSPPLDA